MQTNKTSQDRQRLREAFRKLIYLPVRVVSDGFRIAQGHYEELRGRIVKTSLARRLFEQGALACSSFDGIRAEDGTLCDECQHPCCQPRLRMLLAYEQLIYVLDLPATSAQNYFAFEDQVASEAARVIDCTVRVAVLDRGHWGEVTFEKVEKTDS